MVPKKSSQGEIPKSVNAIKAKKNNFSTLILKYGLEKRTRQATSVSTNTNSPTDSIYEDFFESCNKLNLVCENGLNVKKPNGENRFDRCKCSNMLKKQ